MTAARRLAAILAADIGGYSRLRARTGRGLPKGCVRRREAQPVR